MHICLTVACLVGSLMVECLLGVSVWCGLVRFGVVSLVDLVDCFVSFTGLAVGSAFAALKPLVEFMTFDFARPPVRGEPLPDGIRMLQQHPYENNLRCCV